MDYLLDNGTASFPKTGFCEDLRTRECTRTDSDFCYENDELWGICPYCRVSSELMLSIIGLFSSYLFIFRLTNTQKTTGVSLAWDIMQVVREPLILIR